MVEPTVSAAGMRVVKLLVGRPPQTVADLIDATGVTRTAVTEQLNELVAAGFVERDTERLPGRGRPRHLYTATNAALLLLFTNLQRLVVPAIWKALDEIGGEGLTHDVLHRVAMKLADHYRARITATEPAVRLKELTDLLEQEGGLVEVVEENGELILRKRSCPFISMYEGSESVCSVDVEMLSAVVGCRVVRTACRHHGDPCCSFALAND